MKARNQALLALFVGAPAAMLDQLASYVLVYPSQASHSNWPIAVSAGIAAVIATGGILLALRVLRRKSEVVEADRFLALLGVVLNAFFLLVIVGMAVPAAILHPTD